MSDEMLLTELLSEFSKKVIQYYYRKDQIIEIVEPKVLAWYRERDDRPWLVDKAVCVAQTIGCNRYTHAMGLFAKNPNQPNKDKWRPYLVTAANFTWLELLSRPPSLEDAFLTYRLFFTRTSRPGWERYESSEGRQT